MSSLAAVGAPAPKGAPSMTAKGASDGGGAFGPALTLARGLLDPPAVRPGAGSRATPGPALPVDPAATATAAGETALAALGVVPGPVPGSSLAATPIGLSVTGARGTLDGADPANQAEAGTIPSGSALSLGLPDNRATFLSRAAQGARVEESAAHVPTGLPPAGGEPALPPAVTSSGSATAVTPVAGSPAASAVPGSAPAASAVPGPAQTTPTQPPLGTAPLTAASPAGAAQAVPVPGAPQGAPGAGPQGMPPALAVLGAGSPRSAIPAAEPSAAGTLQPVAPAAQPPAMQSAAAQTAVSAPPAPPAPPVPLATQLYKPVFSLASASKGEHLITVRVAPDEFGPVTVRALVTAEGMRVELFAPTEAAREALRGMLPDLRRDLAAPGLHASLDVSTKDQPGGGDSARGDADGQGPARQDHGRPDRTREPPAPPGPPRNDPSPEESGLPGGTSWNRSTLDLLA
ncbi:MULTISPECIES: flagellar hook-length control protein FliK [unclassified Arthrobacter]|uniref:flagellar hook-length control protein FliK n=1 Tax=unclassified Arthrobacter TaxID=235627 RepID=UPI0014917073|nr:MULTISPECIES: flagellar hook-length control protein FliK [unclassified Arthrobacter]MBE0010809.1 flagellar hook-length control protein FliK [Arthrobacter sp. AET 35A]NOJ64624.1 hypothetical protein [Arthrobacter sp. 147(2020)]